MRAITGNAHITGNDPFNLAILHNDFRGSKPWINFHTQLFGLFGQPATKVPQTDYVVAMVVHVLWHKDIWNFRCFVLGSQQENIITCNRSVQRCTFLFPVWKEFGEGSGLKYGTG